MEEKKYSAFIDNIITLCHLINEYDEFEKRLLAYISPKYNRDFVAQLYDITVERKFKLGAKKAKKFYSENKEIIDTINKYSNVMIFINQNYGFHGESNENFQVIYKYISSHKEEIDKMLVVLQKIKELGFDRLYFNEKLDFTKKIYDVSSEFWRIYRFTYVANAQVIPNYDSYINYRTLDSNYKIELEKSFGEEFATYGQEIIVNSLLFDPNTLPSKLDRENTYDKVVKSKNDQKEKTTMIRNSVNLSVSVSDLERQFSVADVIISRLDGIKNKEEFVAVLSSIRGDLEKLKTLTNEHNASISEQEPLLTPDVLENEKTLYLRRREDASIHWD